MKDIFEHNFYEMTNGSIDASLSFEPRQEKTFADYTTYYANVRNLPKDVVPISIAGRAPDGWKGLEYKRLAPKKWFFDEWKRTGDNDFYVKNFKKEVLEVIYETLRPVQAEYQRLSQSDYVDEVLDKGRARANELANKKYDLVRRAVGFGR